MALQTDKALQQLLQTADPSLAEGFVPSLRHAIQSRTPQFFERDHNGSYVPKPHETMKSYFLQFRWDLGRDFFSEQVKQTRSALEKQKQHLDYSVQISDGLLRPSPLEENKSAFFKEEEKTEKEKPKRTDKRSRCFGFDFNCSIQ